MPNSVAKEKFNQIASTSKVFKLLSEADQATLLAGFAESTDDQLEEAIKAIELQEQKLNQVQQQQLAQAQEQIALSEKLHFELKQSAKLILVSDEAQEAKAESVLLQNIESKLDGESTPVKPSPKKFLGLF